MTADIITFRKLIFFPLILSFLQCESQNPSPTGHLIIIGGGSPRPLAAIQKFVDLAGGAAARIAIIPMAVVSLKPISAKRGLSCDMTPTTPVMAKANVKPIFQKALVRINRDSFHNSFSLSC